MLQTEWCSRARELPSVKTLAQWGTLGSLLFLLSDSATAADIHTVLRNVRNIVYPITGLLLIVSYVCGIYFIFRAIAMMKKFGTMMTMQSQPGELGGPLVHLIVGAILIYIPAATDITMASIFGQTASIFTGGGVNYAQMGTGSTILGYTGADSFANQWADLANTLVVYIQFLGFLSFLRGWFMVAKAGAPGVQPGSIGKGITHIIGGVGLINIVGVVKILQNTILGT